MYRVTYPAILPGKQDESYRGGFSIPILHCGQNNLILQ